MCFSGAIKARIIVLSGVAILLSGCASHNGFETDYDGGVVPYGFFSGIWHGLIFPVAFVADVGLTLVSLVLYIANSIRDMWNGTSEARYIDLALIDWVGEPNTGLFYFIGYCIGLSHSLGGGGGAAGRNP